MQRKKTFLISSMCGALVGALAVRLGTHGPVNIPLFAYDQALLAHKRYLIAAIPWMMFSVYWEIAAKNAAPAKNAESSVSRGLHVFLTNVALLLEIAPIRGLGRFLPASSLTLVAGLVVEALGLSLAIWSRRALGRNWSGEISIKVEHELIRSGPYKMLRHPIYTGLLTMYVGTAVVAGEWLSIIGLSLAVYAYWRKIRLEEASLDMAFGADYAVYRRETWALLPGLY